MAAPQSTVTNADSGFDLTAAPLAVGSISLRVCDLDRMTRFYRDVLGLELLQAAPSSAQLGPDSAQLGAGNRLLLELRAEPGLAPGERGAAGLFHLALLLPRRADLARWLAHALRAGVRLAGASDHKVSEALYLSDPEGNGIEIYADRPPSSWSQVGGQLEMPTDPLDIAALMSAGEEEAWTGIADGSVVGHVHLKVGDTEAAERFYGGVLGLEVTCRYPGGSFFGAGGYHHQLAANVWTSRGAGRVDEHSAGLAGFELSVRDPELLAGIEARARREHVELASEGDGLVLRDPWGIPIALRLRP
jgi:catechol 2,3-dioxygenase